MPPMPMAFNSLVARAAQDAWMHACWIMPRQGLHLRLTMTAPSGCDGCHLSFQISLNLLWRAEGQIET